MNDAPLILQLTAGSADLIEVCLTDDQGKDEDLTGASTPRLRIATGAMAGATTLLDVNGTISGSSVRYQLTQEQANALPPGEYWLYAELTIATRVHRLRRPVPVRVGIGAPGASS